MSFRILFVLTSQDRLGDDGAAAGSWLEELAAPYFVLADAGYAVDFASIMGGNAPIDPASLETPWLTDNGRRLLDNAGVYARLDTTPALGGIDIRDLDALFMVGGAAAVWDFPNDPVLGMLLREFERSDRVIGGVCHGVAGFLNPLAGPIITGRRITCISDQEDTLAGYDQLLPLMPETPLREAGARLSFASEPFAGHAVRDGMLVTGQNPASAARCGELILEALGERAVRARASAPHVG